MSCPKCGSSTSIVKIPEIKKGKRIVHCMEHCLNPNCAYVIRSWKE